MPEYKVEWRIEIEADSPREAAQKALEIQRNPHSIATVFHVSRNDDGEVEIVDLLNDEGEENPFHPESPEGRAWNAAENAV